MHTYIYIYIHKYIFIYISVISVQQLLLVHNAQRNFTHTLFQAPFNASLVKNTSVSENSNTSVSSKSTDKATLVQYITGDGAQR